MSSPPPASAGKRLYPRIPHLPGSRTGPGDRHVDAQAAGRCTGRGRPGEGVLIQEKLDGSCVLVRCMDGELLAFGREGRLCSESRNEGRRAFAEWLAERRPRFEFLQEGERLAGEWLTIAHGTRYALPHEPFVAHDLFTADGRRCLFAELRARTAASQLTLPHVLHAGAALAVEEALRLLGEHGFHGAVDGAEGLVYRVESAAGVELVAKYVRAGKVAGRYLADHSGTAPVSNTWQG